MDFYHAILGVQPDATDEELKAAWRSKCMENHPDRGGDQEEFIKVTHAYKMLTDPHYASQNQDLPRQRDLDFKANVPISFEEAFFGTTLCINYMRKELDSNYNPIKKDEAELVSLKIEVPPGACKGYQVLKSKAGVKMGDKVGDALVHCEPQKHEKFKVIKKDVHSSETLPLHIFLKGGIWEFKTMWGLRKMKIKPGLPPGETIEIPRCGVKKKGMHIITLDYKYPNTGELKSEHYKELKINWDIEKVEDVDEVDKEFEKIFDTLKK